MLELRQPTNKPVCLIHVTQGSESCRICLRQKSESSSSVDFWALYRIKQKGCTIERTGFVHVMLTSVSKMDIVSSCTSSGACDPFDLELYPDDVCEDVHNTQLLNSIQLNALEGQKKKHQSSTAVPRIPSNFWKCVSLKL
uniref:AlNc14C202G8712 protein n=1 Tax=Albugo laibachii Nc14 TaxID=890382 RepID=F0WQQ2_9STRA|nr:AlNc14C202G8712 [Albugo laibachii Nc14]|eukprot:CCA23661.1 AlNc14C202G8712 [Albugo laibachii Nc14]